MTSTELEKVEHVRAQMREAAKAGHRQHHCHWPGCAKQVPPAQWGCTAHWKMLPNNLRSAVWRAYRPGQEESMTPSKAYIAVAHQVQEWILSNHPPNAKPPGLVPFSYKPHKPHVAASDQGSLF